MSLKMLEQYKRINKATGINIHIGSGDHLRISLCMVSIHNDQLSFDKKGIDMGSLNDIRKFCPEGSDLSVNLTGKGVLIKVIENSQTIDQESFNAIFPNASLADFYIQQFISGERSFLSIIRKTEADKILGTLKTFGLRPLLMSLGPFPVENILGQLNFYDQTIKFDGHHIEKNAAGNWTAYSYNQKEHANYPIKVDNEGLDQELLLPYASAFQLMLFGQLQAVHLEIAEISEKLLSKLEKKGLAIKTLICGSILFIVLLVNIIALSFFNSENAKLSEQLSLKAQYSMNNEAISETVENNERTLKILGWENVDKSLYIGQLAQMMPEEIVWKEVSTNPVDLHSTRTEKQLIFQSNTIMIAGTCKSVIPVNEYLERIKTIKWARNVRLESYLFNSESGTGDFTILIKL